MHVLLPAVLCALLTALAHASHHHHHSGHHARHPQVDDLGVHEVDLDNKTAVATLYSRWQRKHGREPSGAKQHLAELANFHAAATRVRKHHHDHLAGLTDTVLALNKFSHMSPSEFRSTRLGKLSNTARHQPPATDAQSNDAPAPKSAPLASGPAEIVTATSKNWTKEGYVTPVKDQGECGCCWTFTVTGALEGAYYKAKKKLLSFSEQELVECVKQWAGCDGGVEDAAFNLVKKNKGINTETTYPYTAMNMRYSRTCKSSLIYTRVPMSIKWEDLPPGDVPLLKAVQTVGPIAVSVAVGDKFQDYAGGVMQPRDYCVRGPNTHAALLVGYGTDETTGENYWLVKNSWSADWGEQGYFRMTRTVKNACGISAEPYQVTVTA